MSEAWYNVGALYERSGQEIEAKSAYANARAHGLTTRLGNVRLSLVEPSSTVRR